MIRVEDMMTRNPHTLLRSHLLSDAKHTMDALGIRHIPIVDSNRHLLGIITQRDVLAAQDSNLQKETDEPSFTLSTPLYEVMRTNVMSVSPKAGLKETAIYMQKHKVGCLPIVDKGRLVGIMTNSDFVAIAINLLELQEEVEPEEVED